jgi:hypothetical protein
MKTSVFCKCIWGILFAFVCSLNMMAVPPQNYMYDTKEENGKLVSKTIFIQKDGLLDKHLKYDFSYNDQGKVSEKFVYRWSNGINEWEPYFRISYQYNETGGISSEYGMWNKTTRDYTLNTQTIQLTEENYEGIFS